MEHFEYERLYRAEERLWWFRGLRLFLSELLPKEKDNLQSGKRVTLDIGCGTGGLLAELSKSGYKTFGMDYSREALHFARERVKVGLVAGSANELPLDRVFDLVICIDLLEVATVDPERLVTNALRVLKPGGYGLFVAAAHQWLLSEHDRAVNSVKRYNLSQLKQLFEKPGIELIRATYLFFLLFPVIAFRKLLNPRRESGMKAVSDVTVPTAWVNEPLFFVCWLESQLLPLFNMPIGSSALILVQKKS